VLLALCVVLGVEVLLLVVELLELLLCILCVVQRILWCVPPCTSCQLRVVPLIVRFRLWAQRLTDMERVRVSARESERKRERVH
jgi:uncharacterized membrane protein